VLSGVISDWRQTDIEYRQLSCDDSGLEGENEKCVDDLKSTEVTGMKYF
jgi:hypothetical protein